MTEDKVYGYVLLPVAFKRRKAEGVEQAVERLWEAGAFDLTDDVECFHADGGFPPTFVEAVNEYEARDQLRVEP